MKYLAGAVLGHVSRRKRAIQRGAKPTNDWERKYRRWLGGYRAGKKTVADWRESWSDAPKTVLGENVSRLPPDVRAAMKRLDDSRKRASKKLKRTGSAKALNEWHKEIVKPLARADKRRAEKLFGTGASAVIDRPVAPLKGDGLSLPVAESVVEVAIEKLTDALGGAVSNKLVLETGKMFPTMRAFVGYLAGRPGVRRVVKIYQPSTGQAFEPSPEEMIRWLNPRSKKELRFIEDMFEGGIMADIEVDTDSPDGTE